LKSVANIVNAIVVGGEKECQPMDVESTEGKMLKIKTTIKC